MSEKTKVASDIFRNRWFRELSVEHKALWLYLTLESNAVGVFEIDAESWNYFCKANGKLKAEDAFVRFGNRIQRLPKHPDKGIIVGKLDYQVCFGKNSKQWEWIVKKLADVGLTYEKLQVMKSHEEEQMELQFDEVPKAEKPKPDVKNIIPPTLEMVKDYCSTRNNSIDAQAFVDYYETRGWKLGKNKMKDWQAAVRTWERREDKKPQEIKTEIKRENIRKMF